MQTASAAGPATGRCVQQPQPSAAAPAVTLPHCRLCAGFIYEPLFFSHRNSYIVIYQCLLASGFEGSQIVK